jgi:5-methylcytosine-specific restriction protein A
MPSSPKRACTTPRCPYTQPCPVHPSKRRWAGRGNADTRGYAGIWPAVRWAVLVRDGQVCTFRMPHPSLPGRLLQCGLLATTVDHIISKSQGGTDHPSNLQSLCATHHASKSGREGRRAR